MPKTRYNFTVDINVLEMAKQLAEWDNRPVSNLLEHLIQQEFSKQSIAYKAGLDKARKIFFDDDTETQS